MVYTCSRIIFLTRTQSNVLWIACAKNNVLKIVWLRLFLRWLRWYLVCYSLGCYVTRVQGLVRSNFLIETWFWDDFDEKKHGSNFLKNRCFSHLTIENPLWCRGVMVIATAQIHSLTPELRFCTGWNPAACRRIGDLRWWGSLTMVPTGNKAKRLS